MQIEELAKKWGYDPKRRTENKAGNEPITDKQFRFILYLWEQHPTEGNELIQLITGTWDIEDMENWTKADGMFVIKKLKEIGS